jgi:hypothetical protein
VHPTKYFDAHDQWQYGYTLTDPEGDAKGIAWVVGQTLPFEYAILPLTAAVEFWRLNLIDEKELAQYREVELEQALRAALPNDRVAPGAVLYVSEGKQRAYYVVTQLLEPDACMIEWRGFHPSRWVPSDWGVKARIPVVNAQRLPLAGKRTS